MIRTWKWLTESDFPPVIPFNESQQKLGGRKEQYGKMSSWGSTGIILCGALFRQSDRSNTTFRYLKML
jgi:hypothetical protein